MHTVVWIMHFLLLCHLYYHACTLGLFQDTITYELPEPVSENKAVDYFFVTPDTGVLHLKQDLQNDEERDTQYQVHVIPSHICQVQNKF